MLIQDGSSSVQIVGRPTLIWIYDCGSEDQAAVNTEVEAYLDGASIGRSGA